MYQLFFVKKFLFWTLLHFILQQLNTIFTLMEPFMID